MEFIYRSSQLFAVHYEHDHIREEVSLAVH